MVSSESVGTVGTVFVSQPKPSAIESQPKSKSKPKPTHSDADTPDEIEVRAYSKRAFEGARFVNPKSHAIRRVIRTFRLTSGDLKDLNDVAQPKAGQEKLTLDAVRRSSSGYGGGMCGAAFICGLQLITAHSSSCAARNRHGNGCECERWARAANEHCAGSERQCEAVARSATGNRGRAHRRRRRSTAQHSGTYAYRHSLSCSPPICFDRMRFGTGHR
jgi:hypothetical protein